MDGSDFRGMHKARGVKYSEDSTYHTAADITAEPDAAPFGTGIEHIDSPEKASPVRTKASGTPRTPGAGDAAALTDSPSRLSTPGSTEGATKKEESMAKRLQLARMGLGADESHLLVRKQS